MSCTAKFVRPSGELNPSWPRSLFDSKLQIRATYSAEAVLYNANDSIGRFGELGPVQTWRCCRTADERTSVDPVITSLTSLDCIVQWDEYLPEKNGQLGIRWYSTRNVKHHR
jgi:hypothetical protein